MDKIVSSGGEVFGKEQGVQLSGLSFDQTDERADNQRREKGLADIKAIMANLPREAANAISWAEKIYDGLLNFKVNFGNKEANALREILQTLTSDRYDLPAQAVKLEQIFDSMKPDQAPEAQMPIRKSGQA